MGIVLTVCSGEDRQSEEHAKGQSEHMPARSGEGMLGGLSMHFPRIAKSFNNVKGVFDQYATGADGSKTVSSDKLKEMLEAIGARNLTNEEVQQLFKVADLDGSHHINFRSWLVVVSGYMGDPKHKDDQKDEKFRETQEGFAHIRKAFDKIDADHGGSVSQAELKEALFKTSSSEESQHLLEARFKELDFDGDGDIYYPEFVYGISHWVVWATGDDDEDEDGNDDDEKD